MSQKRILVLAPHPDDGELSSGGTIRRFVLEEHTIWYAAFSPCNKSLPDGFQHGTLYEELKTALERLGCDPAKVMTFDYPVREFPEYRQNILENLVQIKKEIDPDLVLLPNSHDIHQDHHQIYLEGVRAFKHCSILGYELPWNSLSFSPNYFVRLEETHLSSKINALGAYKTQEGRTYFDADFIKGWARMRGKQVQADFAEAFELVRWIS